MAGSACTFDTGTGDCVDSDGDGVCADTDCGDGRADMFPGAPELCDGLDNDCSGVTDDGNVCESVGNCTRVERGGHIYQFCDRGVEWEEAASRCRGTGYRLAGIGSATENRFVRDHNQMLGLGNDVWIGLTDRLSENVWLWETGEDSAIYQNWDGGEPNNANSGESYVHMRGNGTWNDESIRNMPFVCEFGCDGPDTDGDGLGDSCDPCPDTPLGAAGCAL